MSISQQIKELVCSGFSGIWVDTQEAEDAIEAITALANERDWGCAVWDVDCQFYGLPTNSAPMPIAALRWLDTDAAKAKSTQLLVLKNFHRFMNMADVLTALQNRAFKGKGRGQHVIIVAPTLQLQPEVEKLFTIVHHELPDREQLRGIVQKLLEDNPDYVKPSDDAINLVVDAAGGMSRIEAENAFALSLTRHNKLTPDVVWTLKSQTLEKAGTLQLYRGDASFDALGGLDNLKEFCIRAMRRQGEPDPERRPRGVLLLSPPGCGKSQFAKALGNEVGRPTVILDIGSMMGKFVGESESNMRRALATIDAMAPCILFVDEIEKALSGVGNSGQTDSGVSARLFGTLLTWLNDHKSDVFFIGTCNDASKLPPEFTRAERFDGVFFVDLPGEDARQYIWELYLTKFGLDKKQAKPVDTNWTGAEIKSCCRLASLLEVPLIEASRNVVPVSVTNADAIENLRTWADGRCLSADFKGLFKKVTSNKAQGTRRKLNPSQN
jgi:ATP-dependent 26S proteasome regulatory subunit